MNYDSDPTERRREEAERRRIESEYNSGNYNPEKLAPVTIIVGADASEQDKKIAMEMLYLAIVEGGPVEYEQEIRLD